VSQNNVPQGIKGTLYMARAVSKEKGRPYFYFYIILWAISPIRNGLTNFRIFFVDAFTVFYARALNKPLIHVIGDSHVVPFRGSMPFLAHHLGAATAYNLNKKNNTTKSNEQLFKVIDKLGKKDIVMLCFGEIDCRIHIYYQHKKSDGKYSMEELINRTLSNYGEVMAQLRERGVNFCVYCVSPATKVGNEYKYPFYGSPEIRSQINRMFNEKLRAFCQKNGYAFVDIYGRVADKDGLMRKEYAGDDIHLNKKAVGLVRAEMKAKLSIDV
jgi:lysophospholipase L1-like esterase